MSKDITIPEVVLGAFPALSEATFVRRLASPVPAAPDTTFDIFATTSQGFLCLVTTDYPDPAHQSLELKDISGESEFEFTDLLKPNSKAGETINILENDEMGIDFIIYLPYGKYRLGYYVAHIQENNP